MAHNFRKFWQIYSFTMFTLRNAWKLFPINNFYGTFSWQNSHRFIAKMFTNQQGIQYQVFVLCCCQLGPVLYCFNITCTMIGRNITNHSLEKIKAPCFNNYLLGSKTSFSPMFSIWKWIILYKSKTKEDLQVYKLKQVIKKLIVKLLET